MTSIADWETLEARARAGVPEHRRGWFLSMIRQGREAEDRGGAVLAARCRARIESELAALAASSPELSTDAAKAATLPDGAVAAFTALAARREGVLRARVLELLDRHAERLPVAEREELRAALQGASEPQVAGMRRRLVERLLRAARYRRRAGLFAGWKTAARVEGAGGEEAAPEGPYNDYRALEETLRRVAASNPEWVAEFIDVYGEMRETERKYGEARGRR